jgi:hypothetical protein
LHHYSKAFKQSSSGHLMMLTGFCLFVFLGFYGGAAPRAAPFPTQLEPLCPLYHPT